MLLFTERARRGLNPTNMSERSTDCWQKRNLKKPSPGRVIYKGHSDKTAFTLRPEPAFQPSGKGERVIAHSMADIRERREGLTVWQAATSPMKHLLYSLGGYPAQKAPT